MAIFRRSRPITFVLMVVPFLVVLIMYISYTFMLSQPLTITRSSYAPVWPATDRPISQIHPHRVLSAIDELTDHFDSVVTPLRQLKSDISKQSQAYKQTPSINQPSSQKAEKESTNQPTSQSTKPIGQSHALTTQSSPIILPSAPSKLHLGEHHATFSHTCYRNGYWDIQAQEYVKGKLLLFAVNEKLQKEYENEYFNKNHPDWAIKHEFVSGQFPPRDVPLLDGNTFFYNLFEDNIAQFYQELACHMPIMLNQQYRQQVDHHQHWWSHVFAPYIDFAQDPQVFNNLTNRTEPKARWCPKQLKWVVESMQEYQPNLEIKIHDGQGLSDRMHFLDRSDHEQPLMCFQNVTLYRSGSCNGVSGPYPNGTNAVYAHIKQHIFKQLSLTPHRSCASKMVIYDRYDAPRRRLMNGKQMKEFFEAKIRERPHTSPVEIIHAQDLPKNVIDQARYFNEADIVIQPHSASNYNALFMHDGAAHMEIGQHGTWFGTGIAPDITTGLYYKKWDTGYQLMDYDPKWDNQEFRGERSFYATKELMEDLWTELQPRFCNTTS